MIEPLLSVVEGWTGLLGPFTLCVDDLPFDLTGYTVTPILRDQLGNQITLGGTLAVMNQLTNTGQVTYEPSASDFVFLTTGHTRSRLYRMHFKVVDGAGDVVFFPNGDAFIIDVYRT